MSTIYYIQIHVSWKKINVFARNVRSVKKKQPTVNLRKKEENLVPSDWFILGLSLVLGQPGKDKSLMSITDSTMPDAVIQCKYALVQLCFTTFTSSVPEGTLSPS